MYQVAYTCLQNMYHIMSILCVVEYVVCPVCVCVVKYVFMFCVCVVKYVFMFYVCVCVCRSILYTMHLWSMCLLEYVLFPVYVCMVEYVCIYLLFTVYVCARIYI